MKNEFDIGIVGLGAMGRNLLLNISDHGFRALGLDKNQSKVEEVKKAANTSQKVDATKDLQIFLAGLKKPRAILLLVPAGAAVDSVIDEMSSFLSEGDLIIDAGNSHFKDTDIRQKNLSQKSLHFFGMGVSGGESGARNGPSMMPGGDKAAYERVRPILDAISAKVNGEPCVAYLGPASSGHYVKMVHNGIEYGLMQLIAETYYLMKSYLGLSNDECHQVYKEWNQSELNSYLLEITAEIFLKNDDKSDQRLIDMIRDVAKQKGTGAWTSQDAMELQVPLPTIDAAVSARDLSAFIEDRKKASTTLAGPSAKQHTDQRKTFLEQLRSAYFASAVMTYAQGMALLQKASVTYHYDLNLETIAKIWRGGCIIRAALLESIMKAYSNPDQTTNLLLNPDIAREVAEHQINLRNVIQISSVQGFPVPALMASLAYYDSLRSPWLPANLIQAQRDFFGAHTFERFDASGTFHVQWENS